MRLGDAPVSVFRARLRDEGILLRTGPFVTHLRSPFRDLADAIHFVYASFALEERGFADFHLAIVPPRTLRRFVRRQALFESDGQALFEPYPRALTMPLFEWGLNWCVASRSNQYLIVHSAVLERDGRAVLLPAKPGTGKSTLCAALAHRGWRLLSDEMALIRPADGRLDAVPRPIGLKNESIDIVRAFVPEARIGPVWPNTAKGTVAHLSPPEDAVERAQESAAPAWIVFPRWKAGASARFEAHGKAGAFMRVADNCMNYDMLGETGFETLGATIDACGCWEFEYGRLEDAIRAFEALAAGEPPLGPVAPPP